MLKIDVAIATYTPEGLRRIEKMLPPPQAGIRYIVSWQQHENAEIPVPLRNREDVEIYRFEERGVSKNRNNCLKHCESDIILMADDDLIYEIDFADKIRRAFEQNPKNDLITFKVDYFNKKEYPSKDTELYLPLPKNFYVSLVEIAMRRESVGDMKFCEHIGPGSDKLLCGEDELFFITAVRRGLKCMFVNERIAKHPHLSTGDKITPGILLGQGYIIRQMYPRSFCFRIPLKAYRLFKAGRSPFFSTVRLLFSGSYHKV